MKTICIDFDGVIASYQGWEGADKFGDPVPGVQSALKVLRQEGYRIIIFTTRKVTAALKKYLKDNDITYDYINRNPDQPKDAGTDKPVADIYLDDRAVCFRGNWKYALNDIAYFRPWQAERKDEKAEMEKVFEDYRKYSRQHNEAAGSL